MREYYTVSFKSEVKDNFAYITDYVIRKLGEESFISGRGDESMMKFILSKMSGCRFYFHGLSFYGKFIQYYLDTKGYKKVSYDEFGNKEEKTYTILSNQGVWYKLSIRYEGKNINLYDSKCKLNLPINQLEKAYDIKHKRNKLENETNVVSKALSLHFDNGDKAITSSSDALQAFLKMSGGKRKFRMWAPILNRDDELFVRDSVMGAFLYCNKDETGKGFSMDRNSQYSYIMRDFNLPIGKPKYYEANENFFFNPNKCYIIQCTVTGVLKEGKLPFIPTFDLSSVDNLGNKYVDSLYNRRLTLCMPDFMLLNKNYEIDSLKINRVAEFESGNGMFTKYVNYYGKMKEDATVEGNKGKRQIAKMKLNGLYGKFLQQKFEGSELIYSPIGAYVLSFSRYLIINAAQLDIEHFVYSDTDSLHFDCEPNDIKWDKRYAEFDNKEIGKFKIEFRFKKSRHLWLKEYMLVDSKGNKKTAVAGVEKSKQVDIPFGEFKHGTVVHGAVNSSSRIEGGAIHLKYDFKL